jgi:hypothetical protein
MNLPDLKFSVSTAVIRIARLGSLVLGTMLLISPMVLANDAESQKDISLDSAHLLRELRSAEDELDALRLQEQDNARLLAELIAAKKTLSELPLSESAVSKRLPEDANKPVPKEEVRSILDELIKEQGNFTFPLYRVANSLGLPSLARSAASNQVTGLVGSEMNNLITKKVYPVDPKALYDKIDKGTKVLARDFPTDFTKRDFGKELRDALVKLLDSKIAECQDASRRFNDSIRGKDGKEHDVKERAIDFNRQVNEDDKKNTSYKFLGTAGLISMTAVLLAALISLFFVARNAYVSGLLKEFLRWNPLLDLSTVFVLALAIVMLGLNDKLSSEVLGTLLGGISGYVLGRAARAAGAAAERAEMTGLFERKDSGDSGSGQKSSDGTSSLH